MGELSDVSKLGKYGLLGVMLALVSLTGFSVWALWKTVTNHVEHNTAAQIQTAEVLGKLGGAIEANTKVLEIIDRRIK